MKRAAFNDTFDSEITSVGPKRARENVDAKGREIESVYVYMYARVYEKEREKREEESEKMR